MPKVKQRPPHEPLPLTEKNLQCHNCNMRVFWSFARDRYIHSQSHEQRCHPNRREVAHPRIRD